MADLSKLYDTIGKDYMDGQTDFYQEVHDSPMEFIEKSLGDISNKTILDIGCGHGKDLRLFEKLGARDVFGIDPSAFMVNEAKKKTDHPNKLFVESIESTHFENNFFDVAASRFVFHYLQDFHKAYKEVARILKKDGLFVIIVDHPFRDLMLQKNKTYGQKELVHTRLFNNGAEITFHSHTMQEYLSADFLKYFELIALEEGMQTDELEKPEIVLPGFLGIAARKK